MYTINSWNEKEDLHHLFQPPLVIIINIILAMIYNIIIIYIIIVPKIYYLLCGRHFFKCFKPYNESVR